MNWKYFYYVVLFSLTIAFQIPLQSQTFENIGTGGTFNGNVELYSQAQVNAFGANNFEAIKGYLLIKSQDITNLTPLNNLDTVTYGVFIEYNRKLVTLNGFDNLIYVGGNLHIEGNPELDSIAAFGKLQLVKGPLVLRNNPGLRACCALYPLVSGQRGSIWGGNFISGNKGCNSEKELRENCDADTDNDGQEDANDACPNDPLKTQPGICGCGVSDLDSDRDGVPNCKDECPNDPNKIAKGDCGCGVADVDSDRDGVADCKDECPNNSSLTKASICGCSNPRILNLQISNVSACNNNGTPSLFDDTFTADLAITFEGSPASGTILITGDATETITFPANITSKSYTFFDLSFRADGTLIDVTATFEGNSACTYRRVFGIFAPTSCSSGACNPPGNIKIDTETYPNVAFISWSDLGIATTYEVDFRPIGTSNWATQSAKTNQLYLNNLLDYTEYEYRIRSFCDGQKFSEYTSGTFTSGGKECKIIRATVQGISCQDNQTPDDASDDYFSFNLFVEGTNVADGFTVNNVAGNNSGRYKILGNFRTADGTLGNGDVIVTVIDDADKNCKLEVTIEDPEKCNSDCQIDYLIIDNVFKCYDRGSHWKTSDDYFKADVTVFFTNPPTTGDLKLTGNINGSVLSTNLQNTTSYTFTKVILPASGNDFVAGATFTNGSNCDYSTDFKGVLISTNKICQNQCNIMNAQVFNVQCVDNSTPNKTSDDYLTFELLVTGINLTGDYQISNVAGTSTGTYNQRSFFRTNTGITDATIHLNLRDNFDANCQFSLSIDNACSGNKTIKPTISNQLVTKEKPWSLYPNPAKTTLNVDYQQTTNKTTIEIYDLIGQRVLTQQLRTNRLDISQLTKGIYLIVLRDGASVLTKKFIKE